MNKIQELLKPFVDEGRPFRISVHILEDIFPSIPLPSTKDIEARIIRSSRGVKTDPLHVDSGMTSTQRLEKWCVENNVSCKYDIKKNQYILKAN